MMLSYCFDFENNIIQIRVLTFIVQSSRRLRSLKLAKWNKTMKKTSSLKTLKNRDKDCQIVRRRGRVFVINKKNKRCKARQA